MSKGNASTAPNPVTIQDPQGAIEIATRAVLLERFTAGLRSAILTGSLARGEGTWLYDRGSCRLAGDAEFIVVFDQGVTLPSADQVVAAQHRIEERLAADGIGAKIGLSPIKPNYLRSLHPHIFAYELLVHGKTIWGDEHMLDLAPPFAASDIPLEDGFRLLMNRIIELLEALCVDDCRAPLPERVRHKAIKLCLDMATSFLLFRNLYEPTYKGRAAALPTCLADATGTPIPCARFVERTLIATRWKLGEETREPTVNAEDLATLIGDVHALWRWELQVLSGLTYATDDNAAMRAWCADQKIAPRLRGWAAVAKRCDWMTRVASIPRWSITAFDGSPRRLVYAAASQVFFSLPMIFRLEPAAAKQLSWSQLRRQLPLAHALAPSASWRSAGAAIAWNYHHFLESTRA
jgi:hypothetical protein